MRQAIKKGKADPSTGSLIIAYTLGVALGISPLEIYKMPAQMVMDLLTIHGTVEEMKVAEMDKIKRK